MRKIIVHVSMDRNKENCCISVCQNSCSAISARSARRFPTSGLQYKSAMLRLAVGSELIFSVYITGDFTIVFWRHFDVSARL